MNVCFLWLLILEIAEDVPRLVYMSLGKYMRLSETDELGHWDLYPGKLAWWDGHSWNLFSGPVFWIQWNLADQDNITTRITTDKLQLYEITDRETGC